MAVAAPPTVALRWDGRSLAVLDQTALPAREVWLELTGAADTAGAIRRLAVRGAPLIWIPAAYGLAMGVARRPGLGTLEDGAELLAGARPTAVNLAWAIGRVRAAALEAGVASMAAAARAEAQRIHAEEDAASSAIARHGAEVLADARRIVTICNTGALAAGGTGTALAVILERHRRDGVRVLACETRPLLQGARLTAFELRHAGVPHEVVLEVGGVDIAPPGTAVRNPAFDVTPAELITALVTERGVVAPPTTAGVAELLER